MLTQENSPNTPHLTTVPKKGKILNDPVYGFISVPYGILFDLIEHRYFQRLRRIKQVSMTHYVYPGALHTRFHHAIGALHLMTQTIEVLRSKGVSISDAEAEAVSIAILLHDIGHGPFSHTLENTLLNIHHEQISLLFMNKLNREFDGALHLAIQIFNDQYPRKFLHQLVSGQLDMDRLDYLNRDSFFTGVYEGVVGYDRIIKMLSVHDNELVVEQKGIYSIEKFLIARRLMYWQVYLHKTVLAAEQMLIRAITCARDLTRMGRQPSMPENLAFFFRFDNWSLNDTSKSDELLEQFALLDDYDVVYALKGWMSAGDPVLRFLATKLINRRLFRLELQNNPFSEDRIHEVQDRILKSGKFPPGSLKYLVVKGKETNSAYSTAKDEIKILLKNGRVQPMSETTDFDLPSKIITKHFLCYPKEIDTSTEAMFRMA